MIVNCGTTYMDEEKISSIELAKSRVNQTNKVNDWSIDIGDETRIEVPAMALNHFSHVTIICRYEDITLQRNHII